MLKPIYFWLILLVGAILTIAGDYYADGMVEQRKLIMIIAGFIIFGILYYFFEKWFTNKFFR